MFIQLEIKDFSKITPLFAPLEHNLSIAAVIEGKNKGWVYCDHPGSPQSAFVGTMEGYFLAGEGNNPSFNSGVRARIQRMIDGDTVRADTQYLEFEFANSEWLVHLNSLFDGLEPLTYLSRYYHCSELAINSWKETIPPGFTMQPIDKEIIENLRIKLEDRRDQHFHPYEWAMGFGTIENYLDHGFGFAVMAGERMASWSMSDCVAGNEAEIGIYTVPEYRRLGLGTIAVAATVEHCFKYRMGAVGWHCNDGNTASQRTAQKVGFELQKTLERHYIVRPTWRHLAELGLRDFHRGDFNTCVDRYRKVFELTDEAEDYIYHLAAMAAGQAGDLERSLTWLSEAAERGWKNHSYTAGRIEFQPLKKMPEWATILSLMKKNLESLND